MHPGCCPATFSHRRAAVPASEVRVNANGCHWLLSGGRTGGQGTPSAALFLEPLQEEGWSVVARVSLGTQPHPLPALVT